MRSWRELSVILVCTACATVGLESLERDAPRCDDFIEFDARTRRAADADAPHLATLRLTCARQVMGGLLRLREARGAEAVQQQLDPMALSLSPQSFERLIDESAADSNLRAMAALATATASTQRTQQARSPGEHAALERWRVDAPHEMGAPPTVNAPAQVKQCEALAPDAALTCLLELKSHFLEEADRARLVDVAHAAARQKLVLLQVLPAAQQAPMLAKWVARFEVLEVAEPALIAALERSYQDARPAIIALQRPDDIERSAVLTEPFLALPSARAQLERLRDEARDHQLQLAQRAGSREWAAAFHRKLAARFGGPPTSWPSASTGRWDTTRYQCARPPGALPSPQGLQLRLVATCKRTKRAPETPDSSDPAMKTFDTERSLEWESVDGTLFVSCAGRVLSQRFVSQDLAVDTQENASELRNDPGVGAAPRSALAHELQKQLDRAMPECRAARRRLIDTDCAALSGSAEKPDDAFDFEERFAQHAFALGRWPECFTRWLDARVGVAPPSVVPDAEVNLSSSRASDWR